LSLHCHIPEDVGPYSTVDQGYSASFMPSVDEAFMMKMSVGLPFSVSVVPDARIKRRPIIDTTCQSFSAEKSDAIVASFVRPAALATRRPDRFGLRIVTRIHNIPVRSTGFMVPSIVEVIVPTSPLTLALPAIDE